MNHEQECRSQWLGLQGLPGRTHEVAQHSDVRAVGSDATGVNGQSQAFRHIKVHTCIVQFRKAETRGGQDAVKSRRIHGPRRAMALPGAARQIVKLLPIAFVPRIHRLIQSLTLTWMQNSGLRFTYTPTAAISSLPQTSAQVPLDISQCAANERVSWPVVSNTSTR